MSQSQPSLDDFFKIIDKLDYQHEYKSMFNIPEEERKEVVDKDQLNYTPCMWDTQGAFVCKDWQINKRDGFVEIKK